MKIVVVCGAGASSSFVALRVRRAAARRGIQVEVTPTSQALLTGETAAADVVLVGAHLAGQAEAITASAPHAAVAVLPESAFTEPTGDTALDAALDAIGDRA